LSEKQRHLIQGNMSSPRPTIEEKFTLPHAPNPQSPDRRQKFPWGWLFIGLLVLALIAIFLIRRNHAANSPDAKKGGAGGKAGSGPVSVVLGKATQKDVPVYLDGLGTVQAFNSVTIRSRVDGQLLKLLFTEGQDVKAGDVLAQLDPAPFETQVQQAEARRAQDAAQLANAQVELKRAATLLESKIVSQEVYDAQKAQTQQLQAAVQADDAAVKSASVQLAYTKITSPIAGRAGIRMVDEGNIVHSSESNGIVVLSQLKPISVVFTLPEQSLKSIQEQHGNGPMTVLAVERDNTTVVDTGSLTVIDNQIDTATGTIRLKAAFPNDQLNLWPGEFVNARLLLTVRKGATVVPASVVQRGPDGPYAFVPTDDQKVKMVPLKVGQITHEEALIESGLNPGDPVVVDGQYKLQDGSQIKPASETAPGEKRGTNSPNTKAGSDKKGKKGGKK
jgi:multidrug efflux system membrane fusion protein